MVDDSVRVNVGPLSGLGSLCASTGRKLREFSDRYMEGAAPSIEWDLREVVPRHMSMAALTAFLSLAHRVRQFTGHPQRAVVKWDPEVFAFWDDVSFLRVAKQWDLLKWDQGAIGGFSRGETNPNSVILAFPYTSAVPGRDRLDEWRSWKDTVRQDVKKDLLLRCGRLFVARKGQPDFPRLLAEELAITCAELVVNALLHGRAMPFVGLQRSPTGVTVAVCDSGTGFLKSLNEKPESDRKDLPFVNDDLEAIVVASLFSFRDFGLRHVIDMVTRYGGWVVMASAKGEIRWRRDLWEHALASTSTAGGKEIRVRDIVDNLKMNSAGQHQAERARTGYARNWDYGLRGARITFEVPVKSIRWDQW